MSTSKTIILSTPKDWDAWIFGVKSIATSNGISVWSLIDPSLTIQPMIPVRPEEPTIQSIKPDATLRSELSAEERADLRFDILRYDSRIKELDKRDALIQEVRKHIEGTIHIKHIVLIKNLSSTYDILRALKKRLAPTDQARENEVICDYAKLKQWNKNQKPEDILSQWEAVYAEARALDLPEVAGERAQKDFIQAIRAIDDSYATALEVNIEQKELDGIKIPELYDLIERFRNHVRKQESLKGLKSINASFATIEQKQQSFKGKALSPPQACPHDCFCGEGKHWFKECPYINKEIRTQAWTGKYDVFTKINESLNNPRWTRTKERLRKTFEYDPDTPIPKEAINSNGKPHGEFATSYKSSFSTSAERNKDNSLYNCWILDGGSDIHVCNEPTRDSWEKTRDAGPDDKLLAGKERYNIEAFGTTSIWIDTPIGKQFIRLTNVALAPGFMTNLVSLDILRKKEVHWNSRTPSQMEHQDGSIFCYLASYDNKWVFTTDSQYKRPEALQPKHTSLAAKGFQKSTEPRHLTITERDLHILLGHAGTKAISKVEVAGADITVDSSVPCPTTIQCETCSISKATQIVSRRTEREFSPIGPFDHLSYDLIPFERSYNGMNQLSHFHCLDSGFHIIVCHHSKTESTEIVLHIVKMIKIQFGFVVRVIHTDGEKTLASEFDQNLKEAGMRVERSAPDTQAQNGDSERAGRSITTKARCIRVHGGGPHNLWNLACDYTAQILNRTPLEKLGWKTPWEYVFKRKPRYAHMYPFLCKAYALEKHIPRKMKLNPRAQIGYFVGYESTNIFKVWIPSKNKVIFTRDVTFDRTSFYNANDTDLRNTLQETTKDLIEKLELPAIPQQASSRYGSIESEWLEPTNTPPTNQYKSTTPIQLLSPQATPEAASPVQSNIDPPTLSASPTPSNISLPASTSTLQDSELSDLSDNDFDEEIDRSNQPQGPGNPGNHATRRNEIYAGLNTENIIPGGRSRATRTALATQSKPYSAYHSAFSTALRIKPVARLHRDEMPPPPKTYKEMLQHPFKDEWQKANDEEIGTLGSKGTYKLTPKLDNTDSLPLMWVWTYKFDENGYILKFKARICARGDLQWTDQETYAATLAAQTFRATTAIVAAYDLETRSYDVINAYVNAKLNIPIRCKCPQGYEQSGWEWEVLMALYGLKESARLWYDDVVKTLAEFGLHPVPGVHCLFSNRWLTLILYVDDIIIAYSKENQLKVDEFEKQLLSRYQIRQLGEATHFLGVRIIRDRPQRKLWLIQDDYIQSLASRFNIIITRVPQTPLPTTKLVPWDGIASSSQIAGYQQKVGSVNFASCYTRPDICRAVSRLSEYLTNPSPQHLYAIDHLLHYLVGTCYLAIEFNGNFQGSSSFLSWSDAAFADNVDTRKSSIGYCFQLYGGPIHYKSTKQRHVTTSSTESEFGALIATAKEFLWWIRLFNYIELRIQDSPNIYCDNQQTIRLLQRDTPKLSTKLKHIDIIQSWLRQEVQEKRVNIDWVPTTSMVADGFTKELSPQKHALFVQQLHLTDISHLILGSGDSFQ